MRITGGIHKNRKIAVKIKRGQSVTYRPTAARTRLAVFNIIQNSKLIPENFLNNAVIADICCGSGSFGLEAISRGTKKVYFIDESSDQLNIVKENIAHIKEEEKAAYILADARNLPTIRERCNIIYIDPPYGSGILKNCLNSIISQQWLESEHIIIVELSKKEKAELSEGIATIDTRTYGKTKLLFLYGKFA
jgi:16S rRNA (guanine966-N2)-methyltransferase